MIGIIFRFGTEIIEVRIDGVNCLFRTGTQGNLFVPINNLRLDKTGVIKEFPDLKDRDDWRSEAINRFKEKLKSLNTEDERVNYVVNDLKKFGYVPMYKQKAGHRVTKF
jgi:hypothetical protein